MVSSATPFQPCGTAEQRCNDLVVPFVACGDLSGFDADRSYPLQLGGAAADGSAAASSSSSSSAAYQYHAPVQSPIAPAYSEHVKLVRASAQPPVSSPSTEADPAHPGPSACRDGPVVLGQSKAPAPAPAPAPALAAAEGDDSSDKR